MNRALYICLCIVILNIVNGEQTTTEELLFPSGYVFTVESESSAPKLADPQLTGSFLFKSENELKQLTKFIRVNQWRSPGSIYYRAHPFFLELLQNIMYSCEKAGIKLELKSGYRLPIEEQLVADDWLNHYGPTGSAAELKVVSSETTEVSMHQLIREILGHSLIPLSEKGRDVGLVLFKDSFLFFMTGTKSLSKPIFAVQGSSLFSTSEQFTEYIYNQVIDSVIQPPLLPLHCDSIKTLDVDESYPHVHIHQAALVVGPLDKPILRQSVEDFNRLIQYPGNNILFESLPESITKATWCGQEGQACNLELFDSCHLKSNGNSPSLKCPQRTMSSRLLKSLLMLQSLAKQNPTSASFLSRIKVVSAWKEPNSVDNLLGKSTDDVSNLLQFEGRQAILSWEKEISQDKNNAILSQLAICAGFDFVKNNGNTITVAVFKQKHYNSQYVNVYKGVYLIPVSEPTEKSQYYQMPGTFTEEDMQNYPLFDGALAQSVPLFDGYTLADFRSHEKQFRYMRISPLILTCVEAMATHLTNAATINTNGKTIPRIKIIHGFMSTMEEQSQFQPLVDPRFYTHALGTAVHLNFESTIDNNGEYDLWKLTEIATSQCAPLFYDNRQNIQLGVYKDGLYISHQPNFNFWFECPPEECPELQPPTMTQDQFKSFITDLNAFARSGRFIQSTDVKQACSLDYPPHKQSDNFIYQQDPQEINSIECNIGETAFCKHTSAERVKAVNEIWNYIKRKPFRISEDKLKASLDGCLLSCSPCMYGTPWRQKLEHCDNLLHWMPFPTLNGEKFDVLTHIYPRGDEDARVKACFGKGQHCIDGSPLMAILFPVVDRAIRWEANKPLMEKLYSPMENPSPILKLVSRIYAYEAHGEVNVWIRRSEDLETMRDSLKTIFIYNQDVTKIHFWLLDSTASASAATTIEGYLEEWTKNGCPINSRKTVTPYQIHNTIPTSYSSSSSLDNKELNAKKETRSTIVDVRNSWDKNGLFNNNL